MQGTVTKCLVFLQTQIQLKNHQIQFVMQYFVPCYS